MISPVFAKHKDKCKVKFREPDYYNVYCPNGKDTTCWYSGITDTEKVYWRCNKTDKQFAVDKSYLNNVKIKLKDGTWYYTWQFNSLQNANKKLGCQVCKKL